MDRDDRGYSDDRDYRGMIFIGGVERLEAGVVGVVIIEDGGVGWRGIG